MSGTDEAVGDTTAEIEEYYDAIAELWNDLATSPIREHLWWPAVRSLLPPVAGQRVLDAGCAAGVYSGWLADQGADVYGIDISEEMIDVAKREFGDRATFRVADLTEPLSFLDDDSFDVVFSQLTLSHVPDLTTPLEEFQRVLAPDGVLVLSTHHPFHDYLLTRDRAYPDLGDAHGADLDPVIDPETHPPRYPDTEPYRIDWMPDEENHVATYYRRSLQAEIQAVLEAGFVLDDLVEPTPDETFETEFPDPAETLIRRPPEALCLRAVPGSDH